MHDACEEKAKVFIFEFYTKPIKIKPDLFPLLNSWDSLRAGWKDNNTDDKL